MSFGALHTGPPPADLTRGIPDHHGPATIVTTTITRSRNEAGNKLLNQYEVVELLGEGAFGKVKLCRNTEDGHFYALKVYRKSTLKRRRQSLGTTAYYDVLKEIEILKKLDHPNIVKLYEVLADPESDKLYLVLDFIEDGPVLQGEEFTEPIPEEQVWHFFHGLIEAVEYLHARGICHRDIKPENLLLTEDGSIKLSDFSVSDVVLATDGRVSRVAGTPAFMAPELTFEDNDDDDNDNDNDNDENGGDGNGGEDEAEDFLAFPTDVWSCGVTLFVMIFGECPFMAESVLELDEMIRTKPLEMPRKCNPHLASLLEQMLAKDPAKRITVPEIKQTHWYTHRRDPVVFKRRHLSRHEFSMMDRWIMLIKLKIKMRHIVRQLRGYLDTMARLSRESTEESLHLTRSSDLSVVSPTMAAQVQRRKRCAIM